MKFLSPPLYVVLNLRCLGTNTGKDLPRQYTIMNSGLNLDEVCRFEIYLESVVHHWRLTFLLYSILSVQRIAKF